VLVSRARWTKLVEQVRELPKLRRRVEVLELQQLQRRIEVLEAAQPDAVARRRAYEYEPADRV
jgi:hypothetical protein